MKENKGWEARLTIGLLGVAFIVLKLTGYIDWSWWWVTLPFYGGVVLATVLMLVILIIRILKNNR